MEYAPHVERYLTMQCKVITQQPTILQCMELGIFDQFHPYKTKNSVRRHCAMKVRTGLILQVTVMLGFESLYDWCYLMIWLFSGAPGDPENNTVMENHDADVLYSTVLSLMYTIWNTDNKAQQDVAQEMMQIALHLTMRRWSALVLAKVPVWYPASCIGLRGNSLTPSKIDNCFSEPSH